MLGNEETAFGMATCGGGPLVARMPLRTMKDMTTLGATCLTRLSPIYRLPLP